MSKKNTFNLGDLSCYRNQLMGIGAILVILCHISISNVKFPYVILKLLSFGNIGVDIFLFVSGIGMGYSLSKVNLKLELLTWYLKRIKRIAIPYIIIICPYWVIYAIYNDITVVEFIKGILTISYWTNRTGLWYLSMLLPLYFITPFLYVFFSESSLKKFNLLVCIIACVLLGNGVKSDYGTIFYNIQFVIKRLPSYFMGLYLFNYVKTKQEIKINTILCLFCLYFILNFLLKKYCLYFLLVIPICSILIYIIKINGIFNSFLNYMGRYSLESYMANHVSMFYLIWLKDKNDFMFLKGNYVYYLSVVLLSFLIMIVASKIKCILSYKMECLK